MAAKSNDTFPPEMIRLLKIFGIGSFLFVLLLSFFNDRRANNTGNQESELWVSDAQRMFFKNLRGAFYDQEVRNDAKMTVYRHGKRTKAAADPVLNFAILINRVKSEAYIYAETSDEILPITLFWLNKRDQLTGNLTFEGGDKMAHFAFAQKIYALMVEEEVDFELENSTGRRIIWTDEKERDAVHTTLEDFFKLINPILPTSGKEIE
jgi:hypothetical protein